MTDLKAGELAKAFLKAVYANFAQQEDHTQELEFLMNGTTEEVFILFGAWARPNGEPYASVDEIPSENLLYMADVYAAIAERSGQSETFKKFVPAEAATAQGQAVLKEPAPAYAKLAL